MSPSPYADIPFPRRSLFHKREYEATIDRVSGSVVTKDEIWNIENTVLPSINEDIASLDGDIASLQSILDSMMEERAALKELEKNYKSHFVSPYSFIPHDIWLEIFSHALALEPCSSCQPSGPIWRLSQVCQTWRNLALSYYPAWCTIEYSTDDIFLEDVEILKLVLKRSDQRLLSITLAELHRDSGRGLLRALLGVLFAESRRWQSLNVSDCHPPSFFASIRGRLPQLESLIVSDSDYTTLDVFNDLPCLTRVSLRGVHAYMDLPGARLTELCLDESETYWADDDIYAYWHFIEECHALQTLHISCELDKFAEEVLEPLSMITFPNICKVNITCMGMLAKLTLPRLHDAALARNFNYRNQMSHSMLDLESLVQRSNCARTITNLKLFDTSLPENSNGLLRSHLFRDILFQTVNLRTLDLSLELLLKDGRPDVSSITQVTELVEALNITAFLPRLSSLILHLRGHTSTTVTFVGRTRDFVSMVKARWEGDLSLGLSKLETLHFDVTQEPPQRIDHEFSDAEIDILRALVKEGMDLSIRLSDRDILQ